MASTLTKRFQKLAKETGDGTYKDVAEATNKHSEMTENDAWALSLFLSEFAVYETTNGHGIDRREKIGNYIESSRGSYLFSVLEDLRIPERLKRLDEKNRPEWLWDRFPS